MRRRETVQQGRQHEVSKHTTVALPLGARLEIDVVAGQDEAQQADEKVRAVKALATEEHILSLAVVGDEDEGRRAAEGEGRGEEDLAEGGGVALGLGEEPVCEGDAFAAGGAEGGDVAEDGGCGFYIVRDAGDGLGDEVAVEEGEGDDGG